MPYLPRLSRMGGIVHERGEKRKQPVWGFSRTAVLCGEAVRQTEGRNGDGCIEAQNVKSCPRRSGAGSQPDRYSSNSERKRDEKTKWEDGKTERAAKGERRETRDDSIVFWRNDYCERRAGARV